MGKKKVVEEVAQVSAPEQDSAPVSTDIVTGESELKAGPGQIEAPEPPKMFDVVINGRVYWSDSEEGARQLEAALAEKVTAKATKKKKTAVTEGIDDYKGNEILVPGTVFPSQDQTILVAEDADYGGAHRYRAKNCLGFNNGNTEYNDQYQVIQFVQKNADGSVIPGLQSEQLILMLLDRHKKLNRRFPSEHYYKLIQGLTYFLEASQARVEDRLKAGTMGELKK